MKVCPKCSAQMKDSARFCTRCGTSLEDSAPALESSAPVLESSAPAQESSAPVLESGAPAPESSASALESSASAQESGMKKLPPKTLAAIGIGAAVLIVLLAVVLLGGGLKATTMHLMRTEGVVGVSDGAGKSVEPRDNLGLYSGYGVDTQSASYAWINLDDMKLTKMDQDSEIAITKEGKKLEVEVKSGGLFFNVTEPLADGETMNIRTSTLLVGVRDTCGWVEDNGSKGARVYILEGTVEAEALDTGKTVTVSAGEMARVFVSENGETEITVQPFVEEHIAPFVLTELKNDAALSAAILEASGLDILNPPDPAERLMAEYREIIASYPILDNGAAKGVTYTFNGTTFADKGLTDAVCVDLDGDGVEELLLVIREQGDWYFGRPISRLEVYGSEMGRAVLFDSADFVDEDYMDEYNNHYSWPNSFAIAVSSGKPCIHLAWAYQAVESEYLFALENGELVLIERADWSGLSTPFTWIYSDDGVYTILELPTLPEDARRKNAYLSLLDEDYTRTLYAELTDLNQDGAEELLVLRDDVIGDNVSFSSYSWDSTYFWNSSYLEDASYEFWSEPGHRTIYETNVRYAKSIDMDQDGKEELFLITEDNQAVAYSWKGTSYERTLLQEEAFEYNGLYRDTVTGNIYLGSTEWRLAGIGQGLIFSGLTDRVECSLNLEDLIDYSREPTPAEQEAIVEAQEEFEREVARFESIENIYPYLYGNSYEWQNQFPPTVNDVRQRLMER